jgi:hydrogenase expression/formation protein HypC
MCLGVPMRVVERDGTNARCEVNGIERTVSLFLLQHEDVGPGDHVMVHVGYAIQKMSEAEAKSVWSALDEAFALEDDA